MFELYDGHGPSGEVVSQYVTRKIPEMLDDKLQKISNDITNKVYQASQDKNSEEQDRLLATRTQKINQILE